MAPQEDCNIGAHVPQSKCVSERFPVSVVNSFSPCLTQARDIVENSGVMTWRIKLKGDGLFFLGVAGCGYHPNQCPQRHPQVWVTCGGSFYWNLFGFGVKTNVSNGEDGNDYTFRPGDIVQMSYEFSTQILTATVEGKSGWCTTRHLEGDGLGAIRPCVYTSDKNAQAILLSCVGAPKREFEERNPQPNKAQFPLHLHHGCHQNCTPSPQCNFLLDLEDDIRYTLREDEKDERIQMMKKFKKVKSELKCRALERRVDLLMDLMGDFQSEMNELRTSYRTENETLQNEILGLRQMVANLTQQNEFIAAKDAGFEVVEFDD